MRGRGPCYVLVAVGAMSLAASGCQHPHSPSPTLPTLGPPRAVADPAACPLLNFSVVEAVPSRALPARGSKDAGPSDFSSQQGDSPLRPVVWRASSHPVIER